VSKPTVFIIEDDDDLRESLQWMIRKLGLDVDAYASPRKFLEEHDAEKPGCLVLDLRLPEMSGLDVQKQLLSQGSFRPFIVLTAHGEVPSAVEAMRLGALDFIEKPFSRQYLLDRIHQAIELDLKTRQTQAEVNAVTKLIETLTRREREVLDLVVSGRLTKQIAKQLGISPKTVEVHRSKVVKKMQVDSVVELVLMVQKHLSMQRVKVEQGSFLPSTRPENLQDQ